MVQGQISQDTNRSNSTARVNGGFDPEKPLTADYLQKIGDYVDDLVKNKGFDGNSIVVFTENYATYPKMSQQIIEYLQKKSYKATEGFATTAPFVDAIKIDTVMINRMFIHHPGDKKRIGIYVGRF
jgi:hypothetical protein